MKNIIHSVVTTQNRPVVVDFRFSNKRVLRPKAQEPWTSAIHRSCRYDAPYMEYQVDNETQLLSVSLGDDAVHRPSVSRLQPYNVWLTVDGRL